MDNIIKLSAKVTGVKGFCNAGHEVGEEYDVSLYEKGEWTAKDRKVGKAPRICGLLYNALYPYITTLQFGGEFPWLEDKDVFYMNCPDPINTVSIEIRRSRT